MTVKSCEKLEKSRVALTIEASAEEFEAAVNKAYLKMRGKINVPGFRVGKAPRKIIEKMYGEEVFYEEAVNIILPDAYEDAIKEQKLDVVGYPEVELESCTKDGVVFKCTVAVYPEVRLGQYKGLEAPKAEVKVAAADVNARLKEMADRNSRLVSVERAVKKGDTADIDFEGFDNGVAFDGGKGENFDLEIGSGSFVPGFEEQLIGMKAGEEKDIDITFPENYAPELAGKPVVFHVKVNEVKEKQVPAIDDEFAKDVSEYDTLDELKDSIRKGIQANHEKQADQKVENDLIDQVVGGMKAEIPDAMIESRIEELVQDFQYRISQQGLKLEQYLQYMGMTMEQFKEQFREQADKQVKMRLAMEAIVAKESIEATEEEFEAEIKRIADAYQMEADKVKSLVDAAAVKKDLAVNKAIDFVKSKANIVAGAAEEKKHAKKTTRKTTKKAAAKKDEEPKEEENKGE